MKKNITATNSEPHKWVIFVQSMKIGTHKNKAIHSICLCHWGCYTNWQYILLSVRISLSRLADGQKDLKPVTISTISKGGLGSKGLKMSTSSSGPKQRSAKNSADTKKEEGKGNVVSSDDKRRSSLLHVILNGHVFMYIQKNHSSFKFYLYFSKCVDTQDHKYCIQLWIYSVLFLPCRDLRLINPVLNSPTLQFSYIILYI